MAWIRPLADGGRSPRGHGRPPEDIKRAAKRVFRTRRARELAVLVWDSLVEGEDAREDHRVRFAHSRLRVELRLSATDDGMTISGQVEPAGPTRAMLHRYGSSVGVVETIADGAFSFDRIAHGTVRLAIEGPATEVIWTDWLQV